MFCAALGTACTPDGLPDLTDGGATGGDAGTDAGAATANDAGAGSPDAGSPLDSGQPTFDAGLSVVDSGTIGEVDGGFAVRIAAARSTAENAALCVSIKPFYWEVGDATGTRTSGSVTGGTKVYAADTAIDIASASKWFYSTYFVQKTNGALTAQDIKFLTFRSGYSKFAFCSKGATETVASCAVNAEFEPANEDKFAYSGGHMQQHAALNGLGAMGNAALATEIRSQIGTDIAFSYNSPQPAGGGDTTAADYSKLLRKIVAGDLVMRSVLGTHAVCTNPDTCPDAVNAPSPPGESWHYSIGHWVEDDPVTGDGAFSSAGAFGFYPWIDSTKTVYGVVARETFGGAISSVKCGRLIRKAWLTGTAQP